MTEFKINEFAYIDERGIRINKYYIKLTVVDDTLIFKASEYEGTTLFETVKLMEAMFGCCCSTSVFDENIRVWAPMSTNSLSIFDRQSPGECVIAKIYFNAVKNNIQLCTLTKYGNGNITDNNFYSLAEMCEFLNKWKKDFFGNF